MFSYADVANFIRQPEFADAIELARGAAEQDAQELKDQKGFIDLVKQAVSAERNVSLSQKDRAAVGNINMTPEVVSSVLFACWVGPTVFEAMRRIHEEHDKPRPHGFGDGRHNDPHCEECLLVHEPARGVA